MTRKIRKAYDALAVASQPVPSPAYARQASRQPEPLVLSIVQALEWAFAVEFAHLDFDDLVPDGARPGVDTISVLIERGVLGCKVDGGGRSRPSSDAEVIVEALSRLPVGCGGRGMAIQMAAHARSGTRPDPMANVVPRLVPVDRQRTKHGLFAKTEVIGHDCIIFRGRELVYDIRWCPMTMRPTADQIASAQRHYLQWWGALLHLRADLATGHRLERVTLTQSMPPMQPWKGNIPN